VKLVKFLANALRIRARVFLPGASRRSEVRAACEGGSSLESAMTAIDVCGRCRDSGLDGGASSLSESGSAVEMLYRLLAADPALPPIMLRVFFMSVGLMSDGLMHDLIAEMLRTHILRELAADRCDEERDCAGSVSAQSLSTKTGSASFSLWYGRYVACIVVNASSTSLMATTPS